MLLRYRISCNRLFYVNDIGKQVADLLELVRQPHRPRKPKMRDAGTSAATPTPKGASASKPASASSPPVNLAEQAAEKVESQVRVFLAACEPAAAEAQRPQSGTSQWWYVDGF